MTEAQFTRDELQLLHEAMADLIDSFANAIEHGGSSDMLERWHVRKVLCETLERKLARAIVGEDGG
jgi:hypothetical protein